MFAVVYAFKKLSPENDLSKKSSWYSVHSIKTYPFAAESFSVSPLELRVLLLFQVPPSLHKYGLMFY